MIDLHNRFPLLHVTSIAGCGPAASVTVPVSGKVTFKGTPCDGALVVFHPKAAEKVNDYGKGQTKYVRLLRRLISN